MFIPSITLFFNIMIFLIGSPSQWSRSSSRLNVISFHILKILPILETINYILKSRYPWREWKENYKIPYLRPTLYKSWYLVPQVRALVQYIYEQSILCCGYRDQLVVRRRLGHS